MYVYTVNSYTILREIELNYVWAARTLRASSVLKILKIFIAVFYYKRNQVFLICLAKKGIDFQNISINRSRAFTMV